MEYCITSDNDGHNYVIPVDKMSDWHEWCDIDSEDERSWEAPEWAKSIGGCPSLVVFKDYRIE
jgi:hypothetical protein